MTKPRKAQLADRKGNVTTKVPNKNFRSNFDDIFKKKSKPTLSNDSASDE